MELDRFRETVVAHTLQFWIGNHRGRGYVKLRNWSAHCPQATRQINETKYSQIEKDGLAMIFAVTRFHRMIFGRYTSDFWF